MSLRAWWRRGRRPGIVVSAWERSTNYQLVREHLVEHGFITSEDLARHMCAFAAGSTPDLRASGRKLAEQLVDASLLSRTEYPDRWALPPLPADVLAPNELPERSYETDPELYDVDPRLVEVRRISEAEELPNQVARWQLGRFTIGALYNGATIADVVWAPIDEEGHGAHHWTVIVADGDGFSFNSWSGFKRTYCETFADALERATEQLQDEVARGLRS